MSTVHVHASIVIKRPVADVWNFAADFENDSLWRAEVDSMRHLTAPPIVVGTRTVERSRVLGQQLETTTEITTYEPHRAIGAQSIAAVTPVVVARTFEAVPGGTRFSYTLDGDVSRVLVFRLLRPLLTRWYQGQIERYLRKLQHLLEAPEGVTAPAAE